MPVVTDVKHLPDVRRGQYFKGAGALWRADLILGQGVDMELVGTAGDDDWEPGHMRFFTWYELNRLDPVEPAAP